MTGKLSGKKIAMIVANRYEDVELLFPILRLAEEGAKILVAAVGDDVKGMFGHPFPIPVMANGNRYTSVAVEDLRAEDIDCLYFPGGFGPDSIRLHQPTLELVRACNRQGKFLAAICHGPWVLISAGVMKGKKATCYVAIKDDVENSGAEFIDVPAIRDGNLITGRVPDDLPELCQEIIKALAE
ncbi:MAG: type 1 glutamine amidotransferase [Anaerolineae bacterium]|nr:type 1 glutamine amidotransferase [Anaerolineae bacterium]